MGCCLSMFNCITRLGKKGSGTPVSNLPLRFVRLCYAAPHSTSTAALTLLIKPKKIIYTNILILPFQRDNGVFTPFWDIGYCVGVDRAETEVYSVLVIDSFTDSRWCKSIHQNLQYQQWEPTIRVTDKHMITVHNVEKRADLSKLTAINLRYKALFNW